MSELSTGQAGLPAPTGPYPVGRLGWHVRAESSADTPAPEPGHQRELMVWIWYPAAPTAGARLAAYLPEGWEQVGQF